MSKQDRFDKKKDASARSAAAEQAKQDKLRKQQESKNPPKMSRDDIKRARRMPGGRPGDRD